ncbi:CPBP family intramembrane metalloprotease [Pontiellaceae bacterium B12219]|nr:CPBP family intramembrane metalloprotease [Pontiellaceae bacterium B12219]
MDETSFTLQTALTLILLVGGFITAGFLYRNSKRNPPNIKHLTEMISDRSWSTAQVFLLLSALFLLYFAAMFTGLFFYEDQIPLAKLIITLCIYSLLVLLIGVINHRRGGSWKASLGMGFSNLWKIRFAPVIYLATIPFIMLISKAWHFVLELLFSSEVELQEVAKIVSGELSWLGILYILTAILAAPVYEEMMFRGVVFPYLVKRVGLKTGVALVSILFALMHFHLPSFVPLLLLSGVLSLSYWRTGSLWTSIGIHMIFNAVTILVLNTAG